MLIVKNLISKEHILSDNTDSLLRLSTKLNEYFIQYLDIFKQVTLQAIWYFGTLILSSIGLVGQASFSFKLSV